MRRNVEPTSEGGVKLKISYLNSFQNYPHSAENYVKNSSKFVCRLDSAMQASNWLQIFRQSAAFRGREVMTVRHYITNALLVQTAVVRKQTTSIKTNCTQQVATLSGGECFANCFVFVP